MTTLQSNKLAMYNAVLEFLRKFASSPTTTNPFPALAAKLATLETLLSSLVASAAVQEQPVAGARERREQALETASQATAIVAGAVLSYARTHERPELVAQVRRVRSDMREKRRAERMRIAQRVHDLAVPLAEPLADFGLTAGMLEELQEQIDAARQAVNASVDTRTAKQVSTQQLRRAFASIDRVFAEIDPMLRKLATLDRRMHDEYLLRRSIVARPGTHANVDELRAANPPATAASPAATERQAA